MNSPPLFFATITDNIHQARKILCATVDIVFSLRLLFILKTTAAEGVDVGGDPSKNPWRAKPKQALRPVCLAGA